MYIYIYICFHRDAGEILRLLKKIFLCMPRDYDETHSVFDSVK